MTGDLPEERVQEILANPHIHDCWEVFTGGMYVAGETCSETYELWQASFWKLANALGVTKSEMLQPQVKLALYNAQQAPLWEKLK